MFMNIQASGVRNLHHSRSV